MLSQFYGRSLHKIGSSFLSVAKKERNLGILSEEL
jgi:hypothetical protein